MTLAYSFNMHKPAFPYQGNRLQQIALGLVVLIFFCVDICEPSGDENRETVPTIMTALQTPTAVSPRLKTPTSKPISTPRLSDATSSHLSPTKKTNGLTDSSSSTRKRSKGIINIFGEESKTMDTDQVGKFFNTGQIDPENTQSGQIPIKTVLHSSIGTTSTKPSESMRMSLLLSKNEKTLRHSERTISKPVTSAPEVLPSPEPSRSVNTMALSPTPNIGIGTINGGNKPSISSPFTGSVDVARETVAQAGPSFIDPHVLSTSGTAPTTQHPKGPRTPTYRIQTLSPTPTPYPTVAQPHRCPLGKGSKQECICMNCEGNTGPGLMCCIDQLYPNDMDQGITLVIDSLSMMNFLPKIASLRKLAGEIINEECSKTPCFQDSVVRKKRSASDWKYGTPIKSWDGSPITPTNTLKPNSKRNAASTAPRVQKPINVNVVMFKIARHPSEQRNLYTAFYVSVDGTNETQILKADVLEKIIRSKKGRLERGLNISINRVAPWHTFSRKFSIGPRTVSSTAAFPSSSIILPGGGTPSIEGQEGRNSTANMSKSTFIIVLVLGIGGFVVLAIIIIYMLVKFLRRMKGEFVPDKAYPNDQKSEAGSDQLIPSFIDPSTPRITDVPKKTVRPSGTANAVGGSGGGGGGAGGGGSGGSKKAKKPMGVKVTYKPPKWD